MEQPLYPCEATACKREGSADQMWALDKGATGGKRVVVCGACGLLARREKIRTFKLSETLNREAELAARHGFFKSLRNAMEVANQKEKKIRPTKVG